MTEISKLEDYAALNFLVVTSVYESFLEAHCILYVFCLKLKKVWLFIMPGNPLPLDMLHQSLPGRFLITVLLGFKILILTALALVQQQRFDI